MDLINLIDEELLKSAKLTGIWERRLRDIERNGDGASDFIENLKSLINDITSNVLKDNSNRKIGYQPDIVKKKRKKQ